MANVNAVDLSRAVRTVYEARLSSASYLGEFVGIPKGYEYQPLHVSVTDIADVPCKYCGSRCADTRGNCGACGAPKGDR